MQDTISQATVCQRALNNGWVRATEFDEGNYQAFVKDNLTLWVGQRYVERSDCMIAHDYKTEPEWVEFL